MKRVRTFVCSHMCFSFPEELHSVCSNTDMLYSVTGQMSVAQPFTWGDEISLLDPDPELPDLKLPSIEKWIGETSADKLTAASSLEKSVFEKTEIDKSNLYGNETQSPALDAMEVVNDNYDDDDGNEDDDDGSSIVEENQSDYSNMRIGKIQGKSLQKIGKTATSREVIKVEQEHNPCRKLTLHKSEEI